jgi:7,8-dihydropterin-6-yl-methyl-4-(beta-D-ribofuranosyl)aminobenzene 5'-phosphate synthase
MEFGELEKLEITVLSDNFVPRPGAYIAEYGFSAYIRAVGATEMGILLDTGCGIALENNMGEAGIDWNDIDYIVLSHRHFDHTGGLLKVVENCRAAIIAHPDVFKPNFLWMRGVMIDGSMPFTKAQLEAKGARFILTKDHFRFMEGIAVSGEIPRVSEEKNLNTFTFADGKLVNDDMKDDMAIFAKTKKGGIVITGCAHAGIINTLLRGKDVLGDIHAALGGFHLMFSPPDVVEKRMEKVMEIANIVAPTHCSGSVSQSYAMRKDLSRFIQLGSGVSLKF